MRYGKTNVRKIQEIGQFLLRIEIGGNKKKKTIYYGLIVYKNEKDIKSCFEEEKVKWVVNEISKKMVPNYKRNFEK